MKGVDSRGLFLSSEHLHLHANRTHTTSYPHSPQVCVCSHDCMHRPPGCEPVMVCGVILSLPRQFLPRSCRPRCHKCPNLRGASNLSIQPWRLLCSGARAALHGKPADTLAGIWSALGRRTDGIVCPVLLCLPRSHAHSVSSTVANKIR